MIDEEICGFVNIFKPTGMTSFEVVKQIKKVLKVKRVGHLGTLDPAAAGVLPVAVGRATKFFDYFLKKDKVYFAMVKFGILTDTLDSCGKVLKREDVDISSEEIEKILPRFIGKQQQIPPKYSAVKVNGEKAYDLARRGKEFELKPKDIEVYGLKLIRQQDKNLFLFEAHVSAGTYIRTLFGDMAGALGTVATTPVIIRARSGSFDIENALTMGEFLKTPKVMSVAEVFCDKPTIMVPTSLTKKITNGVKVTESEFKAEFENDKKVQNLSENDEFLLKIEQKVIGIYKIMSGKVVPLVFLL